MFYKSIDRLHAALAAVYPDLTEDEKRRNGAGTDLLFVSRRNKIYGQLRKMYDDGISEYKISQDADIPANEIHGIQGAVTIDSGCTPEETFLQAPGDFAEDLTANFAISVVFHLPDFGREFTFPAKILPGAKFPEKSLKPKYFGNRANAASRDWKQNNHRS